MQLLAEQPGIGRPGRVAGTGELVVSDLPYIIPYFEQGGIEFYYSMIKFLKVDY